MNSYMKQLLFVLALSFVFWQGVSPVNTSGSTTSVTTLNTTPQPTTEKPLNVTTSEPTNRTTHSTTATTEGRGWMKRGENSGMLERSLYVAIGISALVAIYFIVRWVKTRGRRKAKKYGVIHGTGEPELQPLEKHTDDDEEDIALFEKRPK